MLIAIVFILQSLVELLAIVTVVFRVAWLLLGLRFSLLYLWRFLHEYLLNLPPIRLYLLLNHFYYLRFHVLYLRVEIFIAYFLADLGHEVDSRHPDIAILVLEVFLAYIEELIPLPAKAVLANHL